MTVIAWDGYTLAADKCATQEGIRRLTTKLFRHDNHLIGGAGDLGIIQLLQVWWVNGAKTAEWPAAQLSENDWADFVIIKPNKRIIRYEKHPTPIHVEEEVYACGGGAAFAYGAMAAGANAIFAVEIANHYAQGCGGGVDWMRHAPYVPPSEHASWSV